ncbi:MAG: hypothetical protein A3F09_03065 [Chlamydiae bacterium RIFCSPHIGHO2_12_FULL_49_11]|nr:MAG: hypothetical protein A3F09_03065 [Chlamydiae bacterium RIFCSPHIGHO2_12_FULL_49_11]
MKGDRLVIRCVFCIFLWQILFAIPVDTFYGTLEVTEPVLIDLIESPCMQRLKLIHQYGVAYYTTHSEEYSRYDHSIGVFAVLRLKGASLQEQIAGLLHDVSHTVFSHVGDWVFGKANEEKDYQNSIHLEFLEKCGAVKILARHGIKAESVMPTSELCPLLEKPLPDLCADRIEYNLQGAYHRGFITREEARRLVDDFCIMDGEWVSTNVDLLLKMARFSLFMNEQCWGSVDNYLRSMWLAEALLRGSEIGVLSLDDIRYGTDDAVWKRMKESEDEMIRSLMLRVRFLSDSKVAANKVLRCRFRGVDPKVLCVAGIRRLSEIHSEFGREFRTMKERYAQGFSG